MPSLLFNNIWMLAGLAALAIPVVIHLLLRRKKKRLRFSTIQFFVKQDEQSSQRRKLRNWFLLALRLLICAFLVLAFARPYFNGGAGPAAPGKRQVIVVLDRSLSMQANASDGPKWIRAREAVRQVLSDLKADDRAALVSCAGHAEVLSEWAPAVAVTKLLGDLQPSPTTANLGEGLQQAERLLSLSDPKASTTICVVSDLQRGGCLDLASHPISRDAEIKVIKVGELVTPNVGVTDFAFDNEVAFKPHAVVASFSDEDNPEVKLEVSVDGVVACTRVTPLNAGASTNLELSLPGLKPGWHTLTAQIRGRDPLAADDARFQSVYIPEPARVWVAETRQAQRLFEEESFFVMTAFDPARDMTNAPQSDYRCEKVTPDDLAVRLAGRPKALPCDLVVLPALKQVPAALGEVLNSYLQAGGGLLLFVGEGVSANRYNAEFRDFLPAKLGNMEASADRDFGWRLGRFDTNTPVFAPFLQPNSGDLRLASFSKRFALALEGPGTVLASFEDGVPLLVERRVGNGRVLLVNSSMDTSWNDWPKHKTFVPWLHGVGRQLVNDERRGEMALPRPVISGSIGDVDLGPKAAKGTFTVRLPAGKEAPLLADETGQVRDVRFDAPGIYSFRDSRGLEVQRLAVNVPPEESDLTSLAANDFQQDIARAPDTRPTTLAAGLFGSASNQKELWRVLLLTVLVLLFVELLVANRTLA